MKQKKTLSSIFVYLVAFALMLAFMAGSVHAFASPSAVNLGNASNFAILAKSGIDNSASPSTTTITGDIGTSPAAGTTMTGVSCTRVNGNVIQVDSSGYTGGYDSNVTCRRDNSTFLTTAVGNMEAAITNANGRAIDNTDLTGIAASQCVTGTCDLRGLTLAPGVYTFTGPGNVIITTDVTLSGGANDVWIFIIPGTLDISSAKKVLLSGGAVPGNVFWSVAGATTLGTTSTFEGNILEAGTPIAIQTGATLNGRALSKFAVTLDAATVTKPTAITGATPSVVSLVSPVNNTWSASATPAFTFNHTATPTASCTLFVGGVALGTNSSVASNTNTAITANASLSQGSNSWNVSCTNQSGYVSNSSARTVLVDSISPTATVNSVNGRISSGLGTANTTLAINFTANDTNIINWTLSVKNSSGDLLNNWTGFTSNISTVLGYTVGLNGTYFVNLSVLDNASTISTALFNITVDQSNPVINSVSTVSVTTSGATLTVNVTDTYSGISTCAYSGAGSGNLNINSGLYTATLSGLSASTAYTVTVNCTDNADNSATNTTSFTTSAISPSGSGSSSGSSGGGGGGGGGSVNWSCTGWSVCSSEGISTKTCTQPNSKVTSIQKQSCTPAQTQTNATQTAVSQNTTLAPTASKTTDLGSTGTTSQGNTGVTPTDGNQITGQAVSQIVSSPYTWWGTALVLFILIGLAIGGYFYFRKDSGSLGQIAGARKGSA